MKREKELKKNYYTAGREIASFSARYPITSNEELNVFFEECTLAYLSYVESVNVKEYTERYNESDMKRKKRDYKSLYISHDILPYKNGRKSGYLIRVVNENKKTEIFLRVNKNEKLIGLK